MRAPFVLILAACGAPSAEKGGPAPSGDPAGGVLHLDPPSRGGAMAPNLVPGGPGEAILTWIEPTAEGHRLRMSRLAGMKWGEATTVATSDRMLASAADTPVLARAADGSLVAAWGETTGAHSYDLMLGRATGRRWTRLGRAHDDGSKTEHGFASLVADQRGVLAVWLDGRATSRGEPTSLRSGRIDGGPISGGALVDPRVCDCCPTAAAMTDRGPIVVYRDRGDDEVRDISIARMIDGTWTAPAPVARDGWRIEGCPVNGPAVAARGALVAVAWYTEGGAGPAIKVAFSRDSGASFSAPVEVDRSRDGRVPAGRVGLGLDGAGDAIVSWVAGGGHILVRRIGAGGQAGSIRAVGTTSAKGVIPRVVRVDEWLVVIWTDGSGKDSRLRSSAVALREIGAAAAEPVASEAASGRPVVGQRMPDYRATTPDGRTVSLRDLRGKPVLINLWATWCGPCLEEMPELIALHEKYAARGVELIAISLDDADAREKVLATFQKRGLPFTLWLDPDDLATTVLAAPSLPVTFLIDRDGVIRFRRDGLITAGDRDLNAALTRALDAS